MCGIEEHAIDELFVEKNNKFNIQKILFLITLCPDTRVCYKNANKQIITETNNQNRLILLKSTQKLKNNWQNQYQSNLQNQGIRRIPRIINWCSSDSIEVLNEKQSLITTKLIKFEPWNSSILALRAINHSLKKSTKYQNRSALIRIVNPRSSTTTIIINTLISNMNESTQIKVHGLAQ